MAEPSSAHVVVYFRDLHETHDITEAVKWFWDHISSCMETGSGFLGGEECVMLEEFCKVMGFEPDLTITKQAASYRRSQELGVPEGWA